MLASHHADGEFVRFVVLVFGTASRTDREKCFVYVWHVEFVSSVPVVATDSPTLLVVK